MTLLDDPSATLPVSHPAARQRLAMDAMFHPRSIAVIGATESPNSVGLTVMQNLCAQPACAKIYPVNPSRSHVLSVKAWPNLAAIPEPIDLAVIATPAATVPNIVRQCVDGAVPAVVILSAGFRECGQAGALLEKQIQAEIDRAAGKMRIVGPNCLGIAIPSTGLNATFARRAASPGGVAFLSQSGALCTAVLDWSLQEHIGFSAFVSAGSMLDIGWGDLIEYFGDDPNTKAIAVYMESVGDARAFLSAAREVALSKPIVVVKAGRSSAAATAAASHTGSLTGSDEVIDAAMRRVGILRVRTIAELFDMVQLLDTPRRPRGPRLAIVTNAGGPAILATDALIAAGGELASLSPETVQSLNAALPIHWSHANPIDVLGDAGPDRYAKAVQAAAADPQTDGLLVTLTPQGMTDPTAIAEQLKHVATTTDKPILASWMGGEQVAQGRKILLAAGIPTFDYPDQAAQVFQYMWRYRANLQSLYETVAVTAEPDASAAKVRADEIVAEARRSGQTLLSEHLSKQLLQAYGIPCVRTEIARDEAEAVQLAEEIGYPAVLKLHSQTITHKAAVGGVRLNLSNRAAVQSAFNDIKAAVTTAAGPEAFLGVTVQPMVSQSGYEIILGSSIDPQFGPVLMFGCGGRLVEILKDRALALPPLNATLARRMMEQTQIYKALQRGEGQKPIDLPALEQLIVRFSQLVVEQKWIREIDINPLLVTSGRMIALDARVVLHPSIVDAANLPSPAIRPYPTQYVYAGEVGGEPMTIRPIRPEDEGLLIQFHQGLSDQSLHYRYGGVMKLKDRVAHDRLVRSCFIDYERHIALVADHVNPDTGQHEILAVARLIRLHGRNEAEFSLIVADRWQGRGLGRTLLELLIQVARQEELERIIGHIFSDNTAMLNACKEAGFHLTRPGDSNDLCRDWKAEIVLKSA